MECNLKILFWNVRGLNNGAKHTAVYSVITAASPSIVCLQGTKLAVVTDSLVLDTLGPLYEDFYSLPAIGTRGGMILAWRRPDVSISNPLIGDHHIMALVTPLDGSVHWWLTGVYGPQEDAAKLDFISDLRDVCASRIGLWLLGGDFIVIVAPDEKNNPHVNHRCMNRFRRFIADEELRDLYLHGRRYTWSSERDALTLVSIDRVLCTSCWEIAHPNCLLQCLSSAASDRFPLLMDCVSRPPGARRFHFDRFWPKLDGFHQVVSEAWNSIHPDPIPTSASWHVSRLDAAQDFWPLSHDEAWLRRKLKSSYLGRASLERSIARQRVRLAWLRSDDVAVSYLKIHASHRKQRSIITSLRVGDQLVTGHDAMAEAAFHHFSNVLGTTKQDICDVFNKFHTANGRGFQKLNEALLTLLPKRADPAALSDYRPISLIHLIAKLFAKVLSLRLAPKLGAMVLTNQSTFIAGRCFHDNFLLV
ncbi:uncharacterized protein [Aegilops tauschii subsp. strangulata]|uniref:uncharacterized protein n=1 Tax=Aegilops tauschii subsp. strangulata TaxID=200361 RepID=UPI003CC841D3